MAQSNEVWYIDDTRTVVNFSTAVANGVAAKKILRARGVLVRGTTNTVGDLTTTLFANAGDAVSAARISQAIAEASTYSLPAASPGNTGGGGSGGGEAFDPAAARTITGAWTFNNTVSVPTPTGVAHPTTKDYVDTALTGKVSAEGAQDAVAALIAAGTHTGITFTYNDASNTLSAAVAAQTGGGTTDPEVVRDTIAAALVAGTNVTLTINDAADTITLAVPINSAAISDATTFGRSLITAASAANARTLLGVDNTGGTPAGVFRGAWMSNATYVTRDLVAYTDGLYQTTTDHTSGASFDATKFALLASSGSAGAPTDQTMVGLSSWSLTGEATGTSFFPPRAAKIRYQKRPRMAMFDDLSKAIKVNGYGTGTGTTSFITGRNSSPNPIGHLKFTTPGYTGTRWETILDAPVDLSGSYIRIASRVTSLANVRWIRYFIATSKAAFDAGNYLRWSGISSSSNWMRTFFTNDAVHPALMSTYGTGASLNNIGYVAIELAANTTSNSFDYEIAYMEPVPVAATKAKCVIWHDDSTADSFTNFVRYMAPYNFPGTEAAMYGTLNSSTGNSFENINEMRSAQSFHGWQFGSHSFNYDGHGDVDAASIYSQAQKNRAIGQAVGVTGADDFAWWGGLGASEANYGAIRRAYRSGRWNTSGLTTPEMLPPADPWMMKSLLVGSEAFSDWKLLVDNAILVNGVAIFTFHNYINSDTGAGAQQFRALLNYLDANRDKIDVVTNEEALEVCTSVVNRTVAAIAPTLPSKPSLTLTPATTGILLTPKFRYATSYKVYRGTTAGVTASGTPYYTQPSMENWRDTDTVNGTVYYYKIVTSNGNGDSVASDEVSATATTSASASAPTSAPVVTTGTATDTTQPLTWTAATGATAYTVEYKRTADSSWTTFSTAVTGTSTTVTGLTASTGYDYRVTGTNTTGSGPTSAVVSATTAAAAVTAPTTAPTATLGTATVTTQPVNWNAVSGATAYDVEHKASSGSTWTVDTTTVTGLTYTVTGLSASTGYDYRVRARNTAGPGPYSTVVSGSTAASGSGSGTTTNLYSGTYTGKTATANGDTGTDADGTLNWADPDSAWAFNRQATGQPVGVLASRRPASGNVNYTRYFKTAVPDRQSIRVTGQIGNSATSGIVSFTFVLRASDIPSAAGSVDPGTCYTGVYDGATGIISIFKRNGATETALGSSSAGALAAVGDAYDITFFEKARSGSSVTLCMRKSGVADFDITDTSALTGSYVAIRARRNASSGTAVTGSTISVDTIS